MAIIPGMEGIDWTSMIGPVLYWVGWGTLYIVVMLAFVALWYYTRFKIKATVYQMYGSGKDGVFSFGAPKTNRVRWINNKTAWKSLFPLMNKKEIEPFDSEYIYPGKRIYVFELNDQWIPGRINITQTESTLRAEINPVPYYVRNWQSLAHRKNAEEFAKQGFWEENKYLFITLGVVAFNLVLCGVVIYFTYKFAAGGRAQMASLTDAIRNIGNIPGAGGVVPK